jgi:hypothetical protein
MLSTINSHARAPPSALRQFTHPVRRDQVFPASPVPVGNGIRYIAASCCQQLMVAEPDLSLSTHQSSVAAFDSGMLPPLPLTFLSPRYHRI